MKYEESVELSKHTKKFLRLGFCLKIFLLRDFFISLFFKIYFKLKKK